MCFNEIRVSLGCTRGLMENRPSLCWYKTVFIHHTVSSKAFQPPPDGDLAVQQVVPLQMELLPTTVNGNNGGTEEPDMSEVWDGCVIMERWVHVCNIFSIINHPLWFPWHLSLFSLFITIESNMQSYCRYTTASHFHSSFSGVREKCVKTNI